MKRMPIRGILVAWANEQRGAAKAAAPSAMTSLRRLFIRPRDNLSDHYAKSRRATDLRLDRKKYDRLERNLNVTMSFRCWPGADAQRPPLPTRSSRSSFCSRRL